MEGFLVCSSCGQTFAEFQKTGLFGCSACYKAFEPELERLFKRVQGVYAHRVEPRVEENTVEDLASLKARLQEAVEREAFEEAGALRDRIEKLKPGDG